MAIALIIAAGIVGFICLAGIGANDVANSQAMAVGSGAISLRAAQIIASIFEFAGAALVGHHVSSTVGERIVDLPDINDDNYDYEARQYAYGMLSAIFSTATWMYICTFIKMPVSATHSIIGSLIGFQLISHDWDFSAQNWDILSYIATAWLATPLIALFLSYILLLIADKLWPLYIIDDIDDNKPLISIRMHTYSTSKQQPNSNSASSLYIESKRKQMFPKTTFEMSDYFDIPTKPEPVKFCIIFAILWSTLILFILAAGPPAIEILSVVPWWSFVIIGIASFIITMCCGYFIEPYFRKWYINKYYIKNQNTDDQTSTSGNEDDATDTATNYKIFNNSDYFTLYLVIASASVSFAHGGNDVANVLGPYGQIFQYGTDGKIDSGAEIPLYLAAGGGIAIGIGFVLFGKGVLETVGTKITKINYQTGFIAQYSAALTILICNILALPISTSTVIIGAVSGVGFYSSSNERKIREKIGKQKQLTDRDEYNESGCVNKLLFRLKTLNIKVLLKILATWLVTIPCNALICAATYAIISAIW